MQKVLWGACVLLALQLSPFAMIIWNNILSTVLLLKYALYLLRESAPSCLVVSIKLQGFCLWNTQCGLQHNSCSDSFKYLHKYKICIQYKQLLCKVIGPHQCTIPENEMYWEVFAVNKMLGLHCQWCLVLTVLFCSFRVPNFFIVQYWWRVLVKYWHTFALIS